MTTAINVAAPGPAHPTDIATATNSRHRGLAAAAAAAGASAPATYGTSRATRASLALAVLLSSLGASTANVCLPVLADSFSASFAAVQWVVTGYLLSLTALIVLVARAGDRLGQRTVLLTGTGLFAVASLGCALAPSLSMLVAARMLQGVGAAAMMALPLAIGTAISPAAQLGRTMGLLGAMSAVGTALGPSLCGFLLGVSGWRAVFLVNVPLGVGVWWLVLCGVPRDRPGWVSARSGPLFRAVAGRVTMSLLASAVVAMVLMATLVVGPFYLAGALGLKPFAVGMVMSIGPAVAALTSFFAGHVAARCGTRLAGLAGLAIAACGAGALALQPLSAGVLGYAGALAVLTAGYAIFQTANNSAVMQQAPSAGRGLMAGLLNLSRNLGLVGGASFMGAVFSAVSGLRPRADIPADGLANGLHATFAVGLLLLVAAAALVRAEKP